MRFKIGLKTIVLPLALLCMAVPVLTAIFLVHRQADRADRQMILQYARQTLLRSEQTGDQLFAVRDALNALSPDHRCDETELDRMRDLDLNSTLLQAVGFVKDEAMRCSSFSGAHVIALGKPAIVSDKGTRIWINIPISGPKPNYLVFAMSGAAGIVHRDLPLSFVPHVPGLKLATFNWTHRIPLVTRGAVDPGWITRELTDQAVFKDKGYLVAVVRSPRYDLGSVAAVPLSRNSVLDSQAALILLPIGLVTGIVFAVLMVHVVRTRLSLPSLIQLGLRRNEFFLMFQPGVTLADGRIIAAEALLRWRRPDGEMVSPDVFIAAAEDAGMIRQLTARVVRLLGEAEALSVLPDDFQLAINLSADDLHTSATVDLLRSFVSRPGPGVKRLIVEATERSFVDGDQARGVIKQIRALGMRVAIDDFGTGYCSLAYLAKLHADVIKIDKLFVKAIGTDSPTSAVAGHIVQIARDMKMRTVAEGIETEEQAGILRGLGVHTGQGWLFGPPMSAEELVARVLEQRTPAPATDAETVRQGA